MTAIKRTNASHSDFKRLVALLDNDLRERDGKENDFYAQFNKLDSIKHAVLLYEQEEAVGCGAMKEFEQHTMEIKRMYVLPEHRGKGLATRILSALEDWARELSYEFCVLETGKRQPEAIRLYEKNGYDVISNYGQYKHVENSVCFKKKIGSI